jgi:PD-(D/E)XK nuclease superfamily protein
MKYAVIPPETERVGSAVIGGAIEVHRHLGPGFLEHEVHEAKVISYLKTTGLRLGYLLNFHHATMKEGIPLRALRALGGSRSSCSSWHAAARIFA